MNDILEPEVAEENQTNVQDRQTTNNARAGAVSGDKFVDELKKPVISIDPLLDFKTKTTSSLIKEDNEIKYHETNKAVLGPGIVLKTLREEAKLSLSDVAKELRLATRHIVYLEQDQFEKFTALAFYIGYLRNYSRLLDADADKLLAKFYAVYKVMPENTNHKRIKTKARVKLWYELWPVNLFYNNNRLAADRKYARVLLTGAAAMLAVFVVWWLWSDSTIESNKKLTLNTIDNKELQSLPPEIVDNLLPSSPVIVQAPKYNKLDDIT